MQSKATRIFGTDGIRGRAGEGWLSLDGVATLGRAAGKVLGRKDDGSARSVLIGHDGRHSGPELQDALTCGLVEQGFEVTSVGLISTPGLALLTRFADHRFGAMISASHNPAEDNGIKLFTTDGAKLSDELEMEIEQELRTPTEPPPVGPRAQLEQALEVGYLEHLLEHAGRDLDLSGLSLVIDCANGGASRIGPRVLEQLGARVHAMCDAPDGKNINQDCGSTHPEALQRVVLEQAADVGIALDGDGDRCILVDERGQLVHGDGILTVVARHAQERGLLSDPRIVATVMSNKGLHRALRDVGVGVVTCAVGDRYVVDALHRERLSIGGEQSGHVVFGADNHFVGDGLYTALRVLRVLADTGRPLSELAAAYQPFPQILVNVPVSRKPALESLPQVMSLVSSIEAELGEDGRVLLRYSGTENLARVMVEGPDQERIQAQAESVAELLRGSIGSLRVSS